MVTIITSTYNALGLLPITASSIASQKQAQIQWIIIDGGSTDGTVDWLRSNADIIDTWISEPDKGIYDAWNKALKYIKGEWVLFIGAGDQLASESVLAEAAPFLATAYPKYDIVYGKLELISEIGRQTLDVIGADWSELKGKWVGRLPAKPHHPEVFHHASLFANDSFDSTYRIAGDAHFLLKHIIKKDPLFIPVVIDKMPLGGASGKISSALKVAQETTRICRDLKLTPPRLHLLSEWVKVGAKACLSVIIPASIMHRIADLWRVAMGRRRRWTIR